MVGRMAESTSLAEGCRLGCERFKVEYGEKAESSRVELVTSHRRA